MKIRFITKNNHKIYEINKILSETGFEVIAVNYAINEIQTEDVDMLVKDKLLKAFKLVGRPVFVEHTGLYIENLNGFPGGLTQIFWDKLQADKFTRFFGSDNNNKLSAKTVIGYCDSMQVYMFEGSVSGKIAPEPRGNRDFQWDCVFIPDGETETFAEMGDRKNEISMRRIAFEKFKDFLKGDLR
ncbi:non-canonical purine NTP pyrophosphatase [Psychrobacter immobilis]|uniref:non-canonical purine NTP pyrophosphatase n=1 Tax=Psychrobacter immobilis TaxID=498 RepID=UPI0019189929|nr:non-canonical purine NTP pyrophosphatase [Psychrobacter immobilis]